MQSRSQFGEDILATSPLSSSFIITDAPLMDVDLIKDDIQIITTGTPGNTHIHLMQIYKLILWQVNCSFSQFTYI